MPQLFMIKKEGFAEVFVAEDGDRDYVNLIFKGKHVIFKMNDPDYVKDFMGMVDQKWVEYTLDNSDDFMVHKHLMNEYSLSLN